MISYRKFNVSYAFVYDGGRTLGMADTRTMSHGELMLALAMVDPFRHTEWMESIAMLRHSGDHMKISIASESDGHGIVHRAITVERA